MEGGIALLSKRGVSPRAQDRTGLRRLAAVAAGLLLAAGPLLSEEPESTCPFHEGRLAEKGSGPRDYRQPLPGAVPPGIRFSHTSALSPAELAEPLPRPQRETRAAGGSVQSWELIQLAVIVSSAVGAVWAAHRKFED
jgi:hypothetical protein